MDKIFRIGESGTNGRLRALADAFAAAAQEARELLAEGHGPGCSCDCCAGRAGDYVRLRDDLAGVAWAAEQAGNAIQGHTLMTEAESLEMLADIRGREADAPIVA